MQTLRAVLRGKIVEYPLMATFVIDQRPITGRQYSLMGERMNISDAVVKFHKAEALGFVTRLRSFFNGKYKTLARR